MRPFLARPAPPRIPAPCPFCGGEAVLELADAWPDHAFLLETCCLASHEAVCHGMADDPERARGPLRGLGTEELLGGRLRRVADGGCGQLLLDWVLAIRPVAFAAAADFVRRHHAHCGAPIVIWTACPPSGVPDSLRFLSAVDGAPEWPRPAIGTRILPTAPSPWRTSGSRRT